MKPNNKADDLMREKLNNYSSPLRAGLFDAIEQKRKEEAASKSKGAWAWKAGLLGFALLLSAGLLCWQYGQSGQQQANSDTSIKTGAITNTAALPVPPLENTTAANTTTIDTENDKVQNIDTDLTNGQGVASVNQTSQNVNRASTQGNLTQNPEFVTELSENLKSKKSDLVLSTTEKESSVFKANSENAFKSPDFQEENKTQQSKLAANAQQASGLKSLSIVDQLTTRGLTEIPVVDAIAMPSIKCGWEGRKLYIYLDAIGSLDMAFRTLTPKSEEFNSYAILRNRTEGMQESFSIGFRASAVTKGGLAARTGIIYSQIQEPFSERIYTTEEFYTETTDQNGVVIGRDTVVETSIDKFTSNNRHRLIDIPLILGYEIDKAKYNIGLNAGTYFNVTATQQGKFLTPNSEIVDFSSNNPDRYSAFKTSVGFSLYGSVAMNYKITPTLHFIFEPYGRYFLDSFTLDGHQLEQNYFTAGMQFGLRMKM